VIRSARPAGLEPATCGLEVRCSIQLSYGRIGLSKLDSSLRIRARDPRGSNRVSERLVHRVPDAPVHALYNVGVGVQRDGDAGVT
jgi:hypothetical protein